MKKGDIIKVAFKTDGDISVIYFGQDTDKNFGCYSDTSKHIEPRWLVLDECDDDGKYPGWECHYKGEARAMRFLDKYIVQSMEWAKDNL